MTILLSQSVNSGNPTRASDVNKSYQTTDGLHTYADVEHWFDPSTGDGTHKAISSSVTSAADSTIKDILSQSWNPASGTAQDGQGLAWNVTLDNDADEAIRFFRWETKAADVSDGLEDLELTLKGFVAGTETDILGFASGAWDFQGLNISNVGNILTGAGTWDDPWVIGGVMYIWVHEIAGGNQWLMFKTSAPVGANQNAVKDDATGFFAQSGAAVPDA